MFLNSTQPCFITVLFYSFPSVPHSHILPLPYRSSVDTSLSILPLRFTPYILQVMLLLSSIKGCINGTVVGMLHASPESIVWKIFKHSVVKWRISPPGSGRFSKFLHNLATPGFLFSCRFLYILFPLTSGSCDFPAVGCARN